MTRSEINEAFNIQKSEIRFAALKKNIDLTDKQVEILAALQISAVFSLIPNSEETFSLYKEICQYALNQIEKK